MPYQSEIIATIAERLNRQYFLPAIQREFVWSTEQVVQLFDSIMRGYPIGSFLFWELKAQNRAKWDVYEFVQRFKPGTHNQLAATDGVQQLTLVLDGQQRLTSLLIGLRGTYTVKKKYMWWGNPKAWASQSLYLDLLKDPRTSEDGDSDIYYGLHFAEQKLSNSDGHWWFKVGQILDFDSEERFYEFREAEKEGLPDTITKGQLRVFELNLDRLYRAMWKDSVIAYYTETDQDYDRVLDIFVRTNQGGTKLSKSDLLLSMVTLKWAGVNAREEIYGFVDRLNTGLERKNDFDKDFVMKACLVLSDLPVQYKVDNFSNDNLELIQTRWPAIRVAIERAVALLNTVGIDRDTLTSANAVIPICYYFFRHPEISLQGSTPFEVRTATRIRRWFTMCLLNNVFGGQSDRILTTIRKVLQEHADGRDFPVESLNKSAADLGRHSHFDQEAVENLLSVEYGKRETFLALSLLYDENRWGLTTYHQDHIFPRNAFTSPHMEQAGLSARQQRTVLDMRDRIGNLELLTQHENEQKCDKPFDEWLGTRDPSFRKQHLIPEDPALYRLERFEEFVKAREDLIRARLKNLFSADSDGPTV